MVTNQSKNTTQPIQTKKSQTQNLYLISLLPTVFYLLPLSDLAFSNQTSLSLRQRRSAMTFFFSISQTGGGGFAHLWFGLWFIGGFGHCDCPWVRGLLQMWWLMGCFEFEIFLFGLVVLYFWIDLLLWGFRIWWYCWVWENGDFEIFNFWILIFGFVFLDLSLCSCSRHT